MQAQALWQRSLQQDPCVGHLIKLMVRARCQGKAVPVGGEGEVAVGEPGGDHQADQLQQASDQRQLVYAVDQTGKCPDGDEGNGADGHHCRLLLRLIPLVLQAPEQQTSTCSYVVVVVMRLVSWVAWRISCWRLAPTFALSTYSCSFALSSSELGVETDSSVLKFLDCTRTAALRAACTGARLSGTPSASAAYQMVERSKTSTRRSADGAPRNNRKRRPLQNRTRTRSALLIAISPRRSDARAAGAHVMTIPIMRKDCGRTLTLEGRESWCQAPAENSSAFNDPINSVWLIIRRAPFAGIVASTRCHGPEREWAGSCQIRCARAPSGHALRADSRERRNDHCHCEVLIFGCLCVRC